MPKFGIIREGKVPPDRRAPLSPEQCKSLMQAYPDLEIIVQPSPIRVFADEDYRNAGIPVHGDLSGCSVLFGIKEVPVEMLIPQKTYLFFSHTYKKQPYNSGLLKAILEKKIRLVDYEMLKDLRGQRLLGFGRYAGMVGAYNAFRAWGQMHKTYLLKPAHRCEDRREMEAELLKVNLPKKTRIAITGGGRAAGGALEVLSALAIGHVSPHEYLGIGYDKAVFAQLDVDDYFERKDGKAFVRSDFYAHPEKYRSAFMPFARHTDIYIPCHFWSEKSPFVFTRDDAKSNGFRIKVVSDVSCDIDGPVASTLRPSSIVDPFYGYDPIAEREVEFGTEGSIGVSAVDNLPCELPKDASEDFGNELIKDVIPHFFNGDKQGILENASETTLEGALTPHFAYLADYVR